MSRSESRYWECPACGSKVTTFVPLRETPRCAKHTGGGRQMREVKKR